MNAHAGSATRDLASYSSELVYGDIPDSAVMLAKMLILDWLGSAIVESTQKPGKMLLSIVDKSGGTPESTIIAHARETSYINAALVNGAMSHIVELDDVHKSSILHPGAVVIPATLAVFEREEQMARDLLIQRVKLGVEIGRLKNSVTSYLKREDVYQSLPQTTDKFSDARRTRYPLPEIQ